MDLLQNLKGRGQRFDKNGLLIRDIVGDLMEVGDRQRHVVGEGAVSTDDAHALALPAMLMQAAPAERAQTAADVDLAYDSLSDPGLHLPGALTTVPTNSWPSTPR